MSALSTKPYNKPLPAMGDLKAHCKMIFVHTYRHEHTIMHSISSANIFFVPSMHDVQLLSTTFGISLLRWLKCDVTYLHMVYKLYILSPQHRRSGQASKIHYPHPHITSSYI